VEKRVLLGFGVPDEAEKMVLFSVDLAVSWCSLGSFSWEELDWTGGIDT
jgi:hypothetical protein